MTKKKLMTFAPLAIIAVTLGSVTAIAMNKPDEVNFKHLKGHHYLEAKEHDEHKHSVGKPGTQVRLTGAQRITMGLNETKSINLSLENGQLNGVMNVTLVSDAGLDIVNAPSDYSIDIDSGTNTINLPVELKGLNNGIHFLHIFIQHSSDDGAISSRALAREVHVGKVAVNAAKHFSKSKGITVNTDQGIVSMPANENIF